MINALPQHSNKLVHKPCVTKPDLLAIYQSKVDGAWGWRAVTNLALEARMRMGLGTFAADNTRFYTASQTPCPNLQ